VQAPADKPAPCHLVVAREIRAPRRLYPVELFAPAPDPLGAPGERVIDRSRQRLPFERRIDAVQRRGEAARVQALANAGEVVAARRREPEVDVAVFGDVLVRAQVTDVGQIAGLARMEELVRIASIDLTGGFEEQPGIRN